MVALICIECKMAYLVIIPSSCCSVRVYDFCKKVCRIVCIACCISKRVCYGCDVITLIHRIGCLISLCIYRLCYPSAVITDITCSHAHFISDGRDISFFIIGY